MFKTGSLAVSTNEVIWFSCFTTLNRYKTLVGNEKSSNDFNAAHHLYWWNWKILIIWMKKICQFYSTWTSAGTMELMYKTIPVWITMDLSKIFYLEDNKIYRERHMKALNPSSRKSLQGLPSYGIIFMFKTGSLAVSTSEVMIFMF